MEIDVFVEKCREDAKLPSYANIGDAGMDVYSAVDVEVKPGETVAVPTGIKVAIPIGYEIQVRPRSGISLKTPLRVPNTPGTIDAGYRDEVCVILQNTSKENTGTFLVSEKGNKQGTYKINAGDRIAQFVLKEVPVIKWVETESVQNEGINRGGGFGSSGIK